MIKETTLAYLAGFFDGEGCVSILRYHTSKKNGPPSYGIRASTSQVVPTPVVLLKELFGGHTGIKTFATKRNIFTWAIEGTAALSFLREILPYLLVKKKQVELVIEFGEKFVGTTTHRNKPLTHAQSEERETYKERLTSIKWLGYNDWQ